MLPADFLRAARSQLAMDIPAAEEEAGQRTIGEALTDLPPVVTPSDQEIRDKLRDGSTVNLGMSAGTPSTSLLGYGWSSPEPWGTWSDGPFASLRLPLPASEGPCRVIFELRAFASTMKSRRVSVRASCGGTVARWTFKEDRIYRQELLLSSDQDEAVVEFEIHDPVSPFSAGLSGDRRLLGRLLSVTLTPPTRFGKRP